jgi:hypothetical protein
MAKIDEAMIAKAVAKALAELMPPQPEPAPRTKTPTNEHDLPAAYSINELIGKPFGRAKLWGLFRDGKVAVHKEGRRSFALRRDWENFLASCPTGPNRRQVKPLRNHDTRKKAATAKAQH